MLVILKTQKFPFLNHALGYSEMFDSCDNREISQMVSIKYIVQLPLK